MWYDIREEKPTHDQLCYVTCTKRGSYCFVALYNATYDYFTQWPYRSCCGSEPAIEVTHWMYLPEAPFYGNPKEVKKPTKRKKK